MTKRELKRMAKKMFSAYGLRGWRFLVLVRIIEPRGDGLFDRCYGVCSLSLRAIAVSEEALSCGRSMNTLCHEVAHAITDEPSDHGPLWSENFARIKSEWGVK